MSFHHRFRMVFALLAFTLAPHATAQDEAGHGRASQPVSPSPIAVPLDPATLSTLPRTHFAATAHEKTRQCEGVSLAALLRAVDALPAEPLPGPRLAEYVLITARDGYRVVFSLAELEPALGHQPVWLVDRCDGQSLDEDEGPLRIIVPDESRPARWVRQVQSITVVSAP